MDKLSIINTLKKHKNTLKQDFSITKIGLFGSYAKDTYSEKSDIDLVYELQEGKTLGLKEVDELEIFIKNLFNIDKIDLINHKYINPIIKNELNKTVIYV